ncbi:hypothetical protein [Streptomyces sp. NPDC048419]
MIDTSDIGAFLAWASARANTTPPPSPRTGKKAFAKRLANCAEVARFE